MFYWKTLKERDRLDDLYKDVSIGLILKYILKTWCEYVDWIYLAQDMLIWRAVMYTVMKYSVV
jgi:hypothetical protein